MKLLSCLTLLMLSGAASAQSLDCAALANSASAEPHGYLQQCAHRLPTPTVGPWRVPDGVPEIAFTYDMRGQDPRPAGTLYAFTLDAFDVQTAVGETQLSIFALDFSPDGTTLYAVTGATAVTNPLTLGTLDTTTGAFTIVAPLSGIVAGDSSSGLAIDPSTGTAYFSATGGSPFSSRLYTIDLGTGALTLIGQMTAPTDPTGTIFIDIAINCDGELYGHNTLDDALYSIDTVTGAGTFIGGHGLTANFAQGMDFDNGDGTLYGFIYTGGGTNHFGTFDLTTGAFTTLVQDNPLGEFEGAIPTPCFRPDGIFSDGFEPGIPE